MERRFGKLAKALSKGRCGALGFACWNGDPLIGTGGCMTRYIARRVVGLLVVLVLVLTMVFFMLHAAPGGPETAYLGTNPTPEKREAVMRQLGLDQPLWSAVPQLPAQHLHPPVRQLPDDQHPGEHDAPRADAGHPGARPGLVRRLDRDRAVRRRTRRRPARAFLDALVRVGSVVALSVPASGSVWCSCSPSGSTSPGILPSSGWVPFTEDPVENLSRWCCPRSPSVSAQRR